MSRANSRAIQIDVEDVGSREDGSTRGPQVPVRFDEGADADTVGLTLKMQSALETTLESRRASRVLTRRISETERKSLYGEHRELTERMFVDGLSDAESRRLRYVRWKLDRIEDAEIGDTLDELHIIADYQDNLARQITDFAAQARSSMRRRSKPRR